MAAAGAEEESKRYVGIGRRVRCVSLLGQGLGRHATAVKLEAQATVMARRTLTQVVSLALRSPTAEVPDIMQRSTMVTFVVNATPEVRTRASQGSAEKATGGAVKLGVGTGKELSLIHI